MRKFLLLILLSLASASAVTAATPKLPADALFNDKNVRSSPKTDVTIVYSDNNCYRKIDVSDDAALVSRLKEIFAQDEKLSFNKVEKYNGTDCRVILNLNIDGTMVNVCFSVEDDANASYWVQYCPTGD